MLPNNMVTKANVSFQLKSACNGGFLNQVFYYCLVMSSFLARAQTFYPLQNKVQPEPLQAGCISCSHMDHQSGLMEVLRPLS